MTSAGRWQEAAARCSCAPIGPCRPSPRPTCCHHGGSTNSGAVRVRGSSDQRARPRLWRRRALDPEQGGPTLEVTGVASVGRQRITPNLRLTSGVQVVETLSYVSGAHHVKVGREYNHISFPSRGNIAAAPLRRTLHLQSDSGARRDLGPRRSVERHPRRVRAGIREPRCDDFGYQDLSLFAQDEWNLGRLVIKPGVRYQRQFWQDNRIRSLMSAAARSAIRRRATATTSPRASRWPTTLTGDRRTPVHGSYGVFYDNIIGGVLDVGRVDQRIAHRGPHARAGCSAGVHRLEQPRPPAHRRSGRRAARHVLPERGDRA